MSADHPKVQSPYLDTVREVRDWLAAFADDCPVHGDLRLTAVIDLTNGSRIVATTDPSANAARPSVDTTEGDG